MRKNRSSKKKWDDLLAYAEEKIRRSKVKTLQLEALLASLRQQRESGGQCPTEVANLGIDLS